MMDLNIGDVVKLCDNTEILLVGKTYDDGKRAIVYGRYVDSSCKELMMGWYASGIPIGGSFNIISYIKGGLYHK